MDPLGFLDGVSCGSNSNTILGIANNTTLTLSSNVSFTSSNVSVGTIPNLQSQSGAFLYANNNGIVRYVTGSDVVYDSYKTFAVKIVPVSNGNIALMVDLARRNGFPWDAILGSEIAGDFKPKPRVYLAACEALRCAPHEVVHLGDDAELDVLKSSYLPVRLVIGKGQSLTFSEWNSVKTPTAPAASEVITG